MAPQRPKRSSRRTSIFIAADGHAWAYKWRERWRRSHNCSFFTAADAYMSPAAFETPLGLVETDREFVEQSQAPRIVSPTNISIAASIPSSFRYYS
jgi:hypothetical protein